MALPDQWRATVPSVNDCSRTVPPPDPLRVAGMHRNQWLASVGITGWNGSESPADLRRNTQRALTRYLADRPADGQHTALFLSGRDTAAPVRTIQTVIASLAKRARLKRIPVTATTLRHTFAINYLRYNPGQLAELADLLGHESLDMVTLYERASGDDLSAHSEHPYRNAAG